MSKGNCIYKVCIYVGGFESHDFKVIYTTSKMANAERFLHEYTDQHPEVCKAYIERSYGREELRRFKRLREEEE